MSKYSNNWFDELQRRTPSPDISSRKPVYPTTELVVDRKKLFEDPEFPAWRSSLAYDLNVVPDAVVWKRPKDLSQLPCFSVDGFSRFDIQQGQLGDCWFLAAVANLTLYSDMLLNVVLPNQTFDNDYNGLFRFRFWQYGSWIEVRIDDRLPSYNGKLICTRSADSHEFWSPLLEKAYAKLCSSYESMRGGSTCEALQDFTGGLTEMYDLKDNDLPRDLYEILYKAMDKRSLIAASIEPDPKVTEAKTPRGLVRGHAYSITSMKKVNVPDRYGKKTEYKLIRVRNPWGNEVEWNGPWSDNSEEWKRLTVEQRKTMGVIVAADGEFWIDYEDFLKNFDGVEICHLDPETAVSVQGDRKGVHNWECQQFNGSWVRWATAGGCRNNLETFAYNPQYQIKLKKPDDDDKDGKCTLIVALLQKNRRQERRFGKTLLNIGFSIYRVDDPKLYGQKLPREFFTRNAAVATTKAFSNIREMSSRFKLVPGTYAIIPCTYEPHQEGEFMLRIFSEKEVEKRIDKRSNSIVISPMSDEGEEESDGFREPSLPEGRSSYDAKSLQELLNNSMKDYNQTVSLDTCRGIIALYDVCRTGKLDASDLKKLISDLKMYAKVFEQFDKADSGTMSSFELNQALVECGCEIPERISKVLVLRYTTADGKIYFSDFIKCIIKLKTMMDIFHEYDPTGSGKAEFDLMSFVELTMYS